MESKTKAPKPPRQTCGAKTKRGPCRVIAVMRNGRCRVHGGATPRGEAAGSYKHGKYSKLLPATFARDYEVARKDKKLLALKEEVAFIDSRIAGALARIAEGDTSAFRERLAASWGGVGLALASGDPKALAAAVSAHGAIVDAGGTELEALEEARDLIRDRAKLVTAERDYALKLRATVSIEDMRLLVGELHRAVTRHIADPLTVAKIAEDVARVLGAEEDASGPEN